MRVDTSEEKNGIIASAILNKFNDWPLEQLTKFVQQVASCDLMDDVTQDSDVLEDVRLQLSCFDKIETVWIDSALSFELLRSINALVTGQAEDDPVYRANDYVPDFGGETPTAVKDIPDGIRAIEKILLRLNVHRYGGDKEVLAGDLAEAFCTIINVHPFSDGNGRTARFLLQVVLLREGYRYIELPKYRNDENWREALDRGTKNDFSAATKFLSDRLEAREGASS